MLLFVDFFGCLLGVAIQLSIGYIVFKETVIFVKKNLTVNYSDGLMQGLAWVFN